VLQLRDDLSARLARDAVQGAAASPLHAALLSRLQASGRMETVLTRYQQQLRWGVSAALLACELQTHCRLLSQLALNPSALPSLALHVFCRAGVTAAAIDAFAAFAQRDEWQSAPSPAAADSAAATAAAAAVQAECRQFAEAWLTSAMAQCCTELRVPPTVEQLQQRAPDAWAAACSSDVAALQTAPVTAATAPLVLAPSSSASEYRGYAPSDSSAVMAQLPGQPFSPSAAVADASSLGRSGEGAEGAPDGLFAAQAGEFAPHYVFASEPLQQEEGEPGALGSSDSRL
jgi:hypothetical protein